MNDKRCAHPSAERGGELRLDYDVREDGHSQSVVVAVPTWADIITALRSLDQDRHTEMTVCDDSGAYVTVGGGRGDYHVYIGAVDHEDRVILQRPAGAEAGTKPIDLMMDGRLHRLAAHDVVDLDTALRVVEEFMRVGRPDADLLWRTG